MNYAHPAFNFIMREPDNKQCFDCGSLFPTFSSVNNGVILCGNCAQHHMSFKGGISIIKSLINDNWTDDEVMYLQVSGNKRFLYLMKEFNLQFNQTIEYKYSVIAADYYRKLLFSELYGKDKPTKPEMKTGQMLISKYIEEMNIAAKPKGGFFGKIDSMFSSVKEKISKEAKQLDDKYDIKGKGEKAMQMAKIAGGAIVEKGREISQNPTVKDLAKKTEEGLNKVVQVAKKTLNIEQHNTHNSQQGSNIQYETQSAQFYDSNTINQPNIQHTAQSNQIQNQSSVNPFIHENQHPISSNYPSFEDIHNNDPKLQNPKKI